MKKLFTLIFSAACLSSCRISKPPSSFKVKVDYILNTPGDSSEVWVKRKRMYNNLGYVWYMAKFAKLPDSIKIGTTIILQYNGDSCACTVFKQMFAK